MRDQVVMKLGGHGLPFEASLTALSHDGCDLNHAGKRLMEKDLLDETPSAVSANAPRNRQLLRFTLLRIVSEASHFLPLSSNLPRSLR